MSFDLFANHNAGEREAIGPAAVVLRGFALTGVADVLAAIDTVVRCAPPRHMITPGGHAMSAALTNCGPLGWASDRRGYRYTGIDPQSGLPWPPMPPALTALAASAAEAAGFPHFAPDACLVNHYAPGTRMGLHQDRDEQDLDAPIVSVSLGMTATFLFGGLRRTDPSVRIRLEHGDVVVWGGPDRLRFHGVAPVRGHAHPLVGERRINLTFRKAG
ncbi:DNA oxidative demethylase AlkB [Achromobacter sp. GG226]|uniref:DNA oxidative demethylase AlkB n=1 Tax=Verticiella alkaliphila TaxID=2779529 RepID=UPI001C0E774A|nr:DNA oxidative demethylase AlkB [Verticiella sp. GG226]MBU4609248.1 DNA oxidative demethylase AlkB [Verticiella sp. GG226]